jgi:ubiquinone/menaquinone biosynthesis C-methylase UbiE
LDSTEYAFQIQLEDTSFVSLLNVLQLYAKFSSALNWTAVGSNQTGVILIPKTTNPIAQMKTDLDRVEREREFHDKRFADDTVRHQKLDRYYEASDTLFAKYKSRILENPAGAKVLEYGVGTGGCAFALAERGAFVTGIDISGTAIEIAKREAPKRGVQVEFRLMNAEQLDFGDNSLDMICGTGILHHLDLQKALPEIKCVLKPGGKAFFLEPMGHNPLIRLYRSLTPTLRSVDEHPLLMEDLRFICSHFQKSRTEHFGLLLICAAFTGRFRRSARLRGLLEAIDRRLFVVRFLRRQAWLVLLELENPVKIENAGGEA